MDENIEPASLHPSSDPGVINWDGIQEWDGPAHDLDYDFVWGMAMETTVSASSYALFHLICVF